MTDTASWGRLPNTGRSTHRSAPSRFVPLPPDNENSMLPFGNGRSYGDVCLNSDGTLIHGRSLDRFIAFDPSSGLLECESGVLLSEIIGLALPQGWFPPVTPGTAFVTVGGAIANDVHGKNHHRAGTFSKHVVEFELCRSDGSRLICSAQDNADWFGATVGGLGLTGFISRAKLQLRRVPGAWIRGDSQRFRNLEEFFALSQESDEDYEYTVAWIDCAARGVNLGRGVFMRGNHAPATGVEPKGTQRRVFLTPPVSLVNQFSLSAFNELYFRRPSARQQDATWHFQPFLYPLDGLLEWNRIYGPRGFYQYQCVIPPGAARQSIHEILARISASGVGSFLAVLKNFGSLPSSGLLSFARPGTTLALDFPNRGTPTLRLLDSLDEITVAAGGAVYPAKDARMSVQSFDRFFPMWRDFVKYIDPRFSSSFWRRVTGKSA